MTPYHMSNKILDIQLNYISNLLYANKPNLNHIIFYVPVNADVNQNASCTETCAFTFLNFTNRGSKESVWFQEATHLGKALVMTNEQPHNHLCNLFYHSRNEAPVHDSSGQQTKINMIKTQMLMMSANKTSCGHTAENGVEHKKINVLDCIPACHLRKNYVRTAEISSFQSLSAQLWRSVTRAKNLDPSKTTTFRMAVNCRHRLESRMDP
ncbi:hypothetical protein YC2023_096595 [Brassica napus]